MSGGDNDVDIEDSLWNACAPLRDDGVHISNYIEQITALLFIKAVDEQPIMREEREKIPDEASWEDIMTQVEETQDKEALSQYATTRWENSEADRMWLIEYYDRVIAAMQDDGEFFRKAFQGVTNKFKTDVNFSKTVKRVDSIDFWGGSASEDALGGAYEELLSRYAKDAEGAGQYFTPRPLIETIVRATDPQFDETVHDPAGGTGGFIVSANNHINSNTDNLTKTEEGDSITTPEREAYRKRLTAIEQVPETRRLGVMNMILHDLHPGGFIEGDSLQTRPYGQSVDEQQDVVLANPPFGTEYNNEPSGPGFTRQSNPSKIEFLFLKQIMGRLSKEGRASVIVPEGVLFNQSARDLREELLSEYNLHTILVLPENSFHPYAGVDANVLFFERDSAGTEETWYYDLRTESDSINESNPLTDDHFADFLDHYDADAREGCEHYFSVDIETIEDNDYDLNYKSYKEFSNTVTHRDPAEVLEDLRETTTAIDEELDTLENILDTEASEL
jgi:type I restriction enzyme M protein